MSEARDLHEDLLIKLHLEMKAGRSGSPRAAELRDSMNELWVKLDDSEHELFDELSEDLYLIEGKRLTTPLDAGETVESVRKKMEIAFQEQRDRAALSWSRKLSESGPLLTYVIGRCWDRLGFHHGAVCFYDHAYEHQPKPIYAVSALEALVSAGRVEEAMHRADEIDKRSIVEPMLLLEAASILHRAALAVGATHREALYQRVVRMVEAAWIDSTTTLPSLRAMALLAAGFSYEHLGRPADALRSFQRAVSIYPKEGPLLAHGLALLKSNRPQAIDIFTKAASQGTHFDWPYLYAARKALDDERFAEAEEFCEAGLSVTSRTEMRGRLYEWSAIAAANLGRPDEEVRERFDRALAELPFDPTIQKNAELFVELSGRRPWRMEPPGDERAPTLSILEAAVTGKQHTDAAERAAA